MQMKLTWVLALAAALLALQVAPGAAAASSPVPPECQASDLSPAAQARCAFIARTPNVCQRQGLSEDTQRWCDQLAAGADGDQLLGECDSAQGCAITALEGLVSGFTSSAGSDLWGWMMGGSQSAGIDNISNQLDTISSTLSTIETELGAERCHRSGAAETPVFRDRRLDLVPTGHHDQQLVLDV